MSTPTGAAVLSDATAVADLIAAQLRPLFNTVDAEHPLFDTQSEAATIAAAVLEQLRPELESTQPQDWSQLESLVERVLVEQFHANQATFQYEQNRLREDVLNQVKHIARQIVNEMHSISIDPVAFRIATLEALEIYDAALQDREAKRVRKHLKARAEKGGLVLSLCAFLLEPVMHFPGIGHRSQLRIIGGTQVGANLRPNRQNAEC